LVRLGAAEIRFTTTADGDFAPPPSFDDDDLAHRRRIIADFPWTWLRQVHGVDAVAVEEPGAHRGDAADAAVAVVRNAPVAVVTADCAPIVLVDNDSTSVAVVHAGWRGLTGGVVGSAVDAMRAHGAVEIRAALGPCIHAECYEFAEADLGAIVERFGPDVRSVTKAGTRALDLPAAVRAALDELGVVLVHDEDACTACTPGYWSHRARADKQRQATVAWLA
jgi:hypothetical protein